MPLSQFNSDLNLGCIAVVAYEQFIRVCVCVLVRCVNSIVNMQIRNTFVVMNSADVIWNNSTRNVKCVH